MMPTDPAAVVARARELADETLFPIAQDVDRGERVPAGNLEALAAAGLFGMAGPTEYGGLDFDRASGWRVAAAIGGACGATGFVWAQHHTVVRVLRGSTNEDLVEALLGPMCTGTTIAGVAFAHLRRPGPPAITATRVDGGWRLDGCSPWTTSWGIADLFAIAAVSETGDLIWAMLPGDRVDGVVATPLALPVFAATGTVSLAFDGCVVPDDRIASVECLASWRSLDRYQSAIGNPVTLGIAERATRLLREHGDSDATAADAARRLDDDRERRAQMYDELLDAAVDSDDYIERASDHRATCIHLALRSTTALLAAVGGRGMDLGHPAQRLAREAAFFVIQAQTADGRAAALRSV
jgi:alkylation response protein AidB-like acyl-CoA dehydrogenase